MPSCVVCIGGRDNSESDVEFTYENGYVKFDIDSLTMFEMYKIN